jgi:GPI-anchor transamidase subunit S
MVNMFHKGAILESNGFLIPQWGGIVIVNPSFDDSSSPIHLGEDQLHSLMEIYIEQLRSLLGITPLSVKHQADLLVLAILTQPGIVVNIEQETSVGISDWELDRLIRQRALKNMADTVSTLVSLSQQLTALTTMVVKDHIRTIVQSSIDSLTAAKGAFINGDFEQASHHARNAITSAEKAFFDPTIVPLLYFPDEHKLAIYMPFFVPIALPLLRALWTEIKANKDGRSRKIKTQ